MTYPPNEASPSPCPQGYAARRLVDVTMFWSNGPGGVARYLQSKGEWLRRRSDWNQTIFVPGPESRPDRVRSPRLPFSGGYRLPWRRRAAARQLVALAPDLIEAGDPYRLAWSAIDASDQTGARLAAFCHSDVEQLAADEGGRAARLIARRYLLHVYRHFDVVFAASRWMADRLRDLGLDNVRQQPLGVDLSTFNPSRRDARWRQDRHFELDDFLLIYAGRFSSEKNLDVLTQVVNRLGPPFRLLLLGQGPLQPTGSRVHCLASTSRPREVATALASADAFVHAGVNETFGLAPLEALACGTPVVARGRGAVSELLCGDAGIAVDSAGITSFCEAIAALRDGERVKQRAAARACALPYAQDAVYSRLLDCYDDLAGRQSVRWSLPAVYA